MSAAAAIEFFRSMLWTAVLVTGPSVAAAVVVGLILAIFQAATQINDQTVAFAPKALVIVAALVVGGPFMLGELVRFTQHIFEAISKL